jgi:hypothetical protein
MGTCQGLKSLAEDEKCPQALVLERAFRHGRRRRGGDSPGEGSSAGARSRALKRHYERWSKEAVDFSTVAPYDGRRGRPQKRRLRTVSGFFWSRRHVRGRGGAYQRSGSTHSTRERATRPPYRDEADFWRVRELLLETYPTTPPDLNWEVRRWDGSGFHKAGAAWDPY